MDRLNYSIPRSLLDLFLDYSVSNKVFEKLSKEEKNYNTYKNIHANDSTYDNNFNKYDEYSSIQDPDYAYYFNKRNHYKQRSDDIQAVFHKLKPTAAPFYPKGVESEELEKIKTKLSEIDPSKVKEYYPKNYKVVKKEDEATNGDSTK